MATTRFDLLATQETPSGELRCTVLRSEHGSTCSVCTARATSAACFLPASELAPRNCRRVSASLLSKLAYDNVESLARLHKTARRITRSRRRSSRERSRPSCSLTRVFPRSPRSECMLTPLDCCRCDCRWLCDAMASAYARDARVRTALARARLAFGCRIACLPTTTLTNHGTSIVFMMMMMTLLGVLRSGCVAQEQARAAAVASASLHLHLHQQQQVHLPVESAPATSDREELSFIPLLLNRLMFV